MHVDVRVGVTTWYNLTPARSGACCRTKIDLRAASLRAGARVRVFGSAARSIGEPPQPMTRSVVRNKQAAGARATDVVVTDLVGQADDAC
jgi:hypothetical protein